MDFDTEQTNNALDTLLEQGYTFSVDKYGCTVNGTTYNDLRDAVEQLSRGEQWD